MKLMLNQKLALQKLAANSYVSDIPNATLRSLELHGLIEQTGDWYYCLTEAGVRELGKIESGEQ